MELAAIALVTAIEAGADGDSGSDGKIAHAHTSDITKVYSRSPGPRK